MTVLKIKESDIVCFHETQFGFGFPQQSVAVFARYDFRCQPEHGSEVIGWQAEKLLFRADNIKNPAPGGDVDPGQHRECYLI